MATKTKKENLLELPQADPNLTGFVDTDGRPYFFTEGKRKIHVRPVARLIAMFAPHSRA